MNGGPESLVERRFTPVTVAYGQSHDPDVTAYEVDRERLREVGYSRDGDGVIPFPAGG